ncbi:MAG: 4Fe-4S dicluster domain-containing protein [Oscillospiraceae bacterium]|nr:4Fe-4S dicluster domain-containing protein [Oscillospiraceae bacterium]
MTMEEKLHERLLAMGVAEIAAAPADNDAPAGMKYSLSLVVRLSDAVVEGIEGAPTHSYFHHYRTVNAFIDQAVLAAGMLLQQNGWRYMPVGASQSINLPDKYYEGLYSHKKAACRAGLGGMGRSNLFLHRLWGPRVRLGTLFTDCPLPGLELIPCGNPCTGCNACVTACPAQALTGNALPQNDAPRELRIDPAACSEHMKRTYQHIGRGAVCGVCMAVCPVGQSAKKPTDGLLLKCICEDDPDLIFGKAYPARLLKDGWYALTNEQGKEYSYPPELFEEA